MAVFLDPRNPREDPDDTPGTVDLATPIRKTASSNMDKSRKIPHAKWLTELFHPV